VAILNNGRAYSAGYYSIELQHTFAGWVKSVEGGDATAEVVAEKMGADKLVRKHLGPLKYNEISFKFGSGMSQKVWDWIKNSWKNTDIKNARQDGAMVMYNYQLEEMSRLEWKYGLITEFGIPALDAKAKDPCDFTCKFQPELTENKIKKGSKMGSVPSAPDKQKKWLTSNFRFRLDGISDDACKHVAKIEALTIKQKTTENATGESRDYMREPTSVEIPNVVITLPEAYVDDFVKWHQDFVIKGNCEQDKEKHGSIELLTPNLKEVLLTIDLKHCGIFKCARDKGEALSDNLLNWKIEMYCEDIELQKYKETYGNK
jgi:hypothetical protein